MSAPKLGAPDHHLDNLCVILDYNGIQLDDFVKKILDLEPVTDKLKSFGWPVLEVNGHDIAQIDKALDQAEATKGGAHVHRGPHRQGQGRVLHGERPGVARQGARSPRRRCGHPGDRGRARRRRGPRRSSRSCPPWGRSDGGQGLARRVRRSADRARRQGRADRHPRRRSLEVHHDRGLRQEVPGPRLQPGHRRVGHDRRRPRAWP